MVEHAAGARRARFVLGCQQLLMLLVVVAIVAPAANLVTLDIVAPPAQRPTSVAVQPGR